MEGCKLPFEISVKRENQPVAFDPSLWLSKWKTSSHQSGGNTESIKIFSVLGLRIFLINKCRGGEYCFYIIAASVK